MPSPILSRVFAVVAAAGILVAMAPQVFAATDDLDEELIITNKKLGPLSDWAKMQADNARYEALKARFQPDEGGVSARSAAADRNAAKSPTQREPGYLSELRNSPTPPLIQAAEDAVLGR